MWLLLFFFLILLVYLFIFTRPYLERRELILVFNVAIILRFVFVLISHYLIAPMDSTHSTAGLFFNDAQYYDYSGWFYSERWKGIKFYDPYAYRQPSESVISGQVYYVAAIYWLVGHSVLAVNATNAVLGSVACLFVYFIAKIVFNERIAKIAAITMAINPALIIWSGTLLKEDVFVFLLSLTIWKIMDMQRKYSIISVLIIIASLFCLSTIRPYIALVILMLLPIHIVMNNKVKRIWIIISYIVLLSLMFFLNSRATQMLSFRTLQIANEGFLVKQETTNYSFFNEVKMSTLHDALIYIPLMGARLLLNPMPWKTFMSSGVFDYIQIPGFYFWYLTFPLAFYGFVIAIRHNPKSSFLIYSIVLSTFLILIFVFRGGSSRHRIMLLPILQIFIALGISDFYKWKYWYIICVAGIGTLFCSFYAYESGLLIIPITSFLVIIIVVIVYYYLRFRRNIWRA